MSHSHKSIDYHAELLKAEKLKLQIRSDAYLLFKNRLLWGVVIFVPIAIACWFAGVWQLGVLVLAFMIGLLSLYGRLWVVYLHVLILIRRKKKNLRLLIASSEKE